jgi:sugar O-acyltransferase (sialic acid O-acetyltransferase NeuD family)
LLIDRIYIWGVGGHAVSVADVAVSTGIQIEAFVDPEASCEEFLTRPVVEDIVGLEQGCSYFVAIGANFARERVFVALQERFPRTSPATLVHSTAVVGLNSRLNAGSILHANAVVGPGSTLGVGSLVNTGAILEHESELGAFASLAPGAVVGGRSAIGTRSAVSMGAVVKHGTSVGSDTIVGAASFVASCLPNNVIAYGVPARVVRTRTTDEPYL